MYIYDIKTILLRSNEICDLIFWKVTRDYMETSSEVMSVAFQRLRFETFCPEVRHGIYVYLPTSTY